MQVSKNEIDIIQKETRAAALFVHTIAQHMGIQFTDIRCLNYLINSSQATAGELAKETCLTTGAVTAMIDRLEKSGFVKRESDRDDRRKTIVTLKSDKFRKSNIATDFFSKDVKKLLSTFSNEEQEIITKWNTKMTNLFQDKINKLNINK